MKADAGYLAFSVTTITNVFPDPAYQQLSELSVIHPTVDESLTQLFLLDTEFGFCRQEIQSFCETQPPASIG